MFEGIRKRLWAARERLRSVRRAIRALRRRFRLTPQENRRFDDAVELARKSKIEEAYWKKIGENRLKSGDTDGALRATAREAEARQTRREAEDTIRELGGDPDVDVPEVRFETSDSADGPADRRVNDFEAGRRPQDVVAPVGAKGNGVTTA